MTPEKRHELTRALARLTTDMAADLREEILAPGPVRAAARRLKPGFE